MHKSNSSNGNTMTLGQKLYKIRTEANMSVETLSRKSGVPMSVIRNYERDMNDPSFFRISCIAAALNVSLDYLAGNTKINERKLHK